MDFFASIKRALTLMCAIYTVIISGMYLLGWAFSGTGVLLIPTPQKALLLLLFSGIVGFASLLLSKNGTGAVRLILNFLICLVAFILVFIVGGGFPVSGGTSVVAVILYLAVYIVAMILRAVIYRLFRAKATEREEYTSVFK